MTIKEAGDKYRDYMEGTITDPNVKEVALTILATIAQMAGLNGRNPEMEQAFIALAAGERYFREELFPQLEPGAFVYHPPYLTYREEQMKASAEMLRRVLGDQDILPDIDGEVLDMENEGGGIKH